MSSGEDSGGESDDQLGGVLSEVLKETVAHSGQEGISPEQHAELKRAVFGEEFRRHVFADRTYFVLGSYQGGRGERVELVCERLEARDAVSAFLMRDIPDVWEHWTVKFRVLESRADYIVLVMEDTAGSHHWELGQVDRPEMWEKVYVLKREYDDPEVEQERFSAMAAHSIEHLDQMDGDHVLRWRDVDELLAKVCHIP